MILLDTNYLIRSLVPESDEANRIIGWITDGEELCTSSIAWYEFLCGPVDNGAILMVSSLVDERIIPFTADQAAEAFRLFNRCERKRHLRVDAMIAAAAIVSGSRLATGNLIDFNTFVPFGLALI